MDIISRISVYIIMLSVAYSAFGMPHVISEYRGLQKTEGNPGIGVPAPNERYRHGINEWIFIASCITLLPLLVFLEQIIQNNLGITAAAIFTLVIAIICFTYSRKKGKENQAIIESMSKEERYRYPDEIQNEKWINPNLTFFMKINKSTNKINIYWIKYYIIPLIMI